MALTERCVLTLYFFGHLPKDAEPLLTFVDQVSVSMLVFDINALFFALSLIDFLFFQVFDDNLSKLIGHEVIKLFAKFHNFNMVEVSI
jgi:hypothetical protein